MNKELKTVLVAHPSITIAIALHSLLSQQQIKEAVFRQWIQVCSSSSPLLPASLANFFKSFQESSLFKTSDALNFLLEWKTQHFSYVELKLSERLFALRDPYTCFVPVRVRVLVCFLQRVFQREEIPFPSTLQPNRYLLSDVETFDFIHLLPKDL